MGRGSSRAVRKRAEITRISRALPNYSWRLTFYTRLPSCLRKRPGVQKLVAGIGIDATGPQTALTFPTGDVLYCPSGSAQEVYHVIFLYVNVTYLGQYLRGGRPADGDVVLDIGANVGSFALAASRLVGPAGHVYCCEPMPENRECLRRTIEANGLGNVTIVPVAVGDVVGELEIRIGRDSGGHSAVLVGDGPSVTVPVTTVDALIPETGVGRVGFIKVDVEGMEAEVLRGARDTVRRDAPILAVAGYHKPGDLEVLPALMHEFVPGYQVAIDDPEWGECGVFARLPQEADAAACADATAASPDAT
jgi:FkbM family methyltransferase